jgi:hypothetical protein
VSDVKRYTAGKIHRLLEITDMEYGDEFIEATDYDTLEAERDTLMWALKLACKSLIHACEIMGLGNKQTIIDLETFEEKTMTASEWLEYLMTPDAVPCDTTAVVAQYINQVTGE